MNPNIFCVPLARDGKDIMGEFTYIRELASWTDAHGLDSSQEPSAGTAKLITHNSRLIVRYGQLGSDDTFKSSLTDSFDFNPSKLNAGDKLSGKEFGGR